MNGQALALTSDWLSDTGQTPQAMNALSVTSNSAGCGTTSGGGAGGVMNGDFTSLTVGSTFYYPANGLPNYIYYTTPAPRPIKLTMSEVERLRKLAKADDKIKTILSKFTNQIEIVVDFE